MVSHQSNVRLSQADMSFSSEEYREQLRKTKRGLRLKEWILKRYTLHAANGTFPRSLNFLSIPDMKTGKT